MKLTITELQDNITKRFDKEIGGTSFGIIKTSYNYNNDSLMVCVKHFRDNDNNKVYKLIFNEVVSFRVTQESYIHEFKEEIWEGFSFFWLNRNSRFKKDFNSWSSYESIFGSKQYNSLNAYRIGAQNNFIDVLTTEEPIIELIETDTE